MTEHNPKGKNEVAMFSKSLGDAVEKGGRWTVLVQGRRRLPSSGIAITTDQVLTANHTLERDDDILVVTGNGEEYSAEVAGRDAGSDLAVLRLTEPGLEGAKKTQSEGRVGELVLAIGRPSRQGIEASLGVISSINGPVRSRRGGVVRKFLRTDAVPLPGFSGGPLLDAAGLVVGINTSGLHHGMLLTIPTNLAWETARILAESGTIKRGYLGIRSQVVQLPGGSAAPSENADGNGLLVVQVEADSPAVKSDLMVGDIIVSLAGERICDHDDLAGILVGDVVGQAVSMEIIRGGTPITITITVGELNLGQGRKGRHRRPHHGHHHHP